MSEVRLNLTDSQHTIHGTIHGSIADSCVAALSAEPETIAELEAALARYIKPTAGSSPFAWFRTGREIDDRPWDAGIVVIDLGARIVAVESTYSRPGPTGRVRFHDGSCATDISVHYLVPDDWIFLNSIAEYEGLRNGHLHRRLPTPPLDTRAVLYGRPLLEFITREVAQASACVDRTKVAQTSVCADRTDSSQPSAQQVAGRDSARLDPHSSLLEVAPIGSSEPGAAAIDAIAKEISGIHIRWLMTPRGDLREQSPRDVLLAKQDFIDYDLNTRELQWSLQGEAPPCLATNCFAYRFAGFGTHEWVIYYDLVRHLFWKAFEHVRQTSVCRIDDAPQPSVCQNEIDKLKKFVGPVDIACLEEIKSDWLENPHPDYDARTPAILIQSERQRLPIAISGRDLIIDEDCPECQMLAAETEVSFWGLDGAHMDDDFAFSCFRTREEWEADRRSWEAFSEKFNREWKERRLRPARGLPAGEDSFLDPEPIDPES